MTSANPFPAPSVPFHNLLHSVTVTHPGKVRNNNEDCVFSAPDKGVWLVADGMGGHEAGEVASALVCETFQDSLRTEEPIALPAIIQASHRRILAAADTGQGASGMGSTLVAVHATALHATIAWVGDSRAYCFDRLTQAFMQLTRDHSYVQELVDSGAIGEADALEHPDKNVITQCLGMEGLNEVRVDVVEHLWGTHQWLLLCSDGLTDAVDDSSIREILIRASSIEKACEALLAKALDNGGPDNISIQLIESAQAPSSPPDIPTRQHSQPLAMMSQLTPTLTRNRRVDHWLFGITLVALIAALSVLLW